MPLLRAELESNPCSLTSSVTVAAAISTACAYAAETRLRSPRPTVRQPLPGAVIGQQRPDQTCSSHSGPFQAPIADQATRL